MVESVSVLTLVVIIFFIIQHIGMYVLPNPVETLKEEETAIEEVSNMGMFADLTKYIENIEFGKSGEIKVREENKIRREVSRLEREVNKEKKVKELEKEVEKVEELNSSREHSESKEEKESKNKIVIGILFVINTMIGVKTRMLR